MNHSGLIGYPVVFGDVDMFNSDTNNLPLERLNGQIIAVNATSTAATVRFTKPIHHRANTYSHAVISSRLREDDLDLLLRNKMVLCGITLVPEQQFLVSAPLDISWWRGGNAGITTVYPAVSRSPL